MTMPNLIRNFAFLFEPRLYTPRETSDKLVSEGAQRFRQVLQSRSHILRPYRKTQPEMAWGLEEFSRHNRSFKPPQQVMQRLAVVVIFQSWKDDHRTRRNNAIQNIL